MEKNIEETSEVLDEIPLEEEEIKLKNKPFFNLFLIITEGK